MDIQHDLKLTKPVSVWNQPLKIEPKNFLLKLAKAVSKGVQGDFEDAAENVADALVDLKPEDKAGQLAWLLIYRAFTASLSELIQESLDLFPQTDSCDEPALQTLTASLSDHFAQLEVGINREFFEQERIAIA